MDDACRDEGSSEKAVFMLPLQMSAYHSIQQRCCRSKQIGTDVLNCWLTFNAACISERFVGFSLRVSNSRSCLSFSGLSPSCYKVSLPSSQIMIHRSEYLPFRLSWVSISVFWLLRAFILHSASCESCFAYSCLRAFGYLCHRNSCIAWR